MRDKQKESSGKVVQLVGSIFLLSFLDLGVSHLFIAANQSVVLEGKYVQKLSFDLQASDRQMYKKDEIESL